MSFSKVLKTELCDKKLPECCRKAECYALCLFGQSFTEDKISILTDNEKVADHYAYSLRKVFNIHAKISSSNGKRPMYKAVVSQKEDRIKIINGFGLDIDNPNAGINREIIKKDCCRDSFLRGMFISCGQATDPKLEYRIDIRVKNPELAFSAFDIIYKRGLEPKITLKNLTNVIYLKKSESVEDFLTVMGASPKTLELMDIKILKSVRSRINRHNNAEDANTSRAIEASITQREAIRSLIENGKFSLLPSELQEIALLRSANPEASLNEMCKLCSVSISKSGMNHRLQKIIEIANEYRTEEKRS